MTDITLGEWLPSQPTYKNPGCVEARNVFPRAGGFGPLRSLTLHDEAFTGTCRGASLFFNAGAPFIAGGTEDSLFTREGTTIEEVTGYNAVPAGEFWDFAQFGTRIVATSSTNAPQYLADYTADTTWGALTGSPPTGRYCARVGEFLMIGNIAAGAEQFAWSAFNNITGAWAASRLTQAGTAAAPKEYGAIQGLVGGRYGLLFQERAISRIDYVGPPTVWRRSEFEMERGCTAPASIVTAGYITYFLSQEGFCRTNGSEVENISLGRVSEWFFSNVDQSRLSYTQGAIDWQRRCVWWAFCTSDPDTFDHVILYSWTENRWSHAELTMQWLVGSRRDATSLEDLDALFPGGLETVDPSLDDPMWKAGDRIFAAFSDDDGDTTYSTFDGPTLQADWETGEWDAAGRRVFATRAYPLIETTDWSATSIAAVGSNNDRTPIGRTYNYPGVDGACPLRTSARLMRLGMRRDAGSEWTLAQGMQVDVQPDGDR